jgi:DNA-binding MarR family transcriptional regulator
VLVNKVWEYKIIKRLTESNDNIVSNVSDILNITNASASIAISTLEKKGNVIRVRYKTDKFVKRNLRL